MVMFVLFWLAFGIAAKKFREEKGKTAPGYLLSAVAGPIALMLSGGGD